MIKKEEISNGANGVKKVLIITNLNPHLERTNSRCRGLAKYLSYFGWQPVFLTLPVKGSLNVRIIEVSYKGDIFRWFRRGSFKEKGALNRAKQINSSFVWFFNFYRVFFGFPDDIKKWKKPALKSAIELLRTEKFDAIISSSSPVTAHVVARQLKKKFNLPWIADLRDLWSQNHNYSFPWWRKMIDKRFELKTLKQADALITVSDPWKDKLSSLHKRKVYTITNGFDPDNTSDFSVPLSDKFTITYSGTVYTDKQNPKNLFIALKQLASENIIDLKNIDVRLYAFGNYLFKRMIKEYGLDDVATVYEKVSPKEMLRRENESHILLLFCWGEKSKKGCHFSRTFEYLACQKPILAINGFGGDVIEELISETKSGAYCKTIEEIKTFLKKSYLEYLETGMVSYNGDLNKINKYSHKEMAKKFSNILNGIT